VPPEFVFKKMYVNFFVCIIFTHDIFFLRKNPVSVVPHEDKQKPAEKIRRLYKKGGVI